MTLSPTLPPERARALVSRFHTLSVLVAGDLMLDHFIIGHVSRISPEAPVPVVEHDHDDYRIGGAGNVAHNVRALGGHVELVGLIGRDDAAGRLRGEMITHGMGVEGLVVDPARPTTTKQRIVTTRNQQVARVDYENDAEAAGALEHELIGRATRALAHASVVIVSDYLKGAVTRNLVAALVEGAKARKVPVLVDPKIPHIDYYAGTTVVTPNHHEAETATHMRIRTDDDARKAAKVFIERARCRGVLITRGEHGMSHARPGRRSATIPPSLARWPTSPAPATRSSQPWPSDWRPGPDWPRPHSWPITPPASSSAASARRPCRLPS